MRRNLKKLTLTVSTFKHYFYFTTHFNYYETIPMQWRGLVSYTIASIRLENFVSPSRNAYFSVPLVSICALFYFYPYCVMHVRIPLIPFFCNTTSQYFLIMILPCLENFCWVVEVIHCTLVVFSLQYQKYPPIYHEVNTAFRKICFGCRISAHTYFICVSFITNIICMYSTAFFFVCHSYFSV